MKAYAIAFLGSLLAMGCNIDVDDCGDDDWDDDDDEQPCETHVHSDTGSTTTTVSTVGGGAGSGSADSGSADSGSGGSSGSSSHTGGGPSDSGGSSGSGSGGSGSSGDGGTASGGNASGGTASGGAATGGSAGNDSDTTGAAGSCDDCNPLPDGDRCLWGVQKMDSCCSVDTLVDVAAKGCADYGLELSDFVLQDSCSGRHQQVDYQCCLAGMSGCTTEEVSLESCVGEGVLSVLADQVCADMGQSLSSVEPTEACGADSYQGVEVTCCVIDPE